MRGMSTRSSRGNLGTRALLLGMATWLVCATGLRAEDAILAPGDLILAIDTGVASESRYPTGGNDERPAMILDGNPATKYLNFGKDYSGFIVVPSYGASAVQSMILTTANDADVRDPASYEIYGTNATIVSENNSDGKAESWTLIASGTLSLPATRLTAGPVVSFTNTTVYAAYKVLFPTVKNATSANSMQIAEVGFYESSDGTGTNILSAGGVVLAIDANSASSYPVPSERPANILDGLKGSKYLNFGAAHSGFIVTPTRGTSAVKSFKICTANDVVGYAERNPTSYEIYGTSQEIISKDNSSGTDESWTLIASGELALPLTNLTWGPVVSITNSSSYTSYKVIFPTVRNLNAAGTATVANSMQIAEVAMYESTDGSGSNVLASGGVVLAIDTDGVSQSAYVAASSPQQSLDGDATTDYANTGAINSGFIVTPWVGSTIVTSFKIVTGNGAQEGDPAAWAIYGTTDAITSADNSFGDKETWTLIASGAVALPTLREADGPIVSFANTTAYTSYRILFTALRDPKTATSMQISDIQFYGTILSPLPDPLLNRTDFIIAFDFDPDTCASNYPAAESPASVLDNNVNTKYLNFAQANSGFIVTPVAGPSVIKSMRLSTANDAVERDPASYAVYGTNAAIASTDNSPGNAEAWTLIASGDVTLPDTRLDATTVVAFANNTTSYASYKVIFPTVKNAASANSMQIADVALYASADGAGTSVTQVGDPILAVDGDLVPASSYPAGEPPANAIDRKVTNSTGGASKYLNLGKTNCGFIVKPTSGSTVVTAFKMVTAEDAPERDPAGWELYGTNDPITDVDNGHGTLENWTLISSGTMALPAKRLTAGPMASFENKADYTAYRMVITSVKDATLANSMQFAEVQFYGILGVSCGLPFADADGDKDVDQLDFAVFQLCYTGPGGTATTRECKCFDRDKDSDIDALDLGAFMKCVSGPAIPWTQESHAECVP